MKVILLQDVPDLGKKYELKEVKPGYARNQLIPQKMAKAATKEAMEWLKEQQSHIEEEAKEDLKKAQEVASKLDGLELPIVVKVGEHDELFEGIDAARIVKELKEQGIEVKKSQVLLAKPIKELGDFPVKINLDHNLESEIKVMVSPEPSMAKEEDE